MSHLKFTSNASMFKSLLLWISKFEMIFNKFTNFKNMFNDPNFINKSSYNLYESYIWLTQVGTHSYEEIKYSLFF